MRYIKLFENFNASSIEDAKWIVIHHLGEVEIIDKKNYESGVIKIKFNNPVTQKQLEDCENHLKEEGFFLYLCDYTFVSEPPTIIVGIGESVFDYCEKWLNDNWNDLKMIESVTQPGSLLYKKDGYNDNIIYFDQFNSRGYHYRPLPCAFIAREIWDFLSMYINLDLADVKTIIKKWLNDVWDLDKIDIERNSWEYLRTMK